MSFDTFGHQIVAVCCRFHVDATFGRACVGGLFPEMLRNIPIAHEIGLPCGSTVTFHQTKPLWIEKVPRSEGPLATCSAPSAKRSHWQPQRVVNWARHRLRDLGGYRRIHPAHAVVVWAG